MSTETRSETATGGVLALEKWQAGLLGGIVGALAFGAMMAMQVPGVLEVAIPSMYGFGPGAGAIGFAIHVAHGAVLGVVFAAILDLTGLDASLDDNLKTGVAGLGYGLVVWLLLAALLMPLWLEAVGSMADPPFPNIGPQSVPSILGHAVYGVVLGIVYSVTAEA